MKGGLLIAIFSCLLFAQLLFAAPTYIMRNIRKTLNGYEADLFLKDGTSGPYGEDSSVLRFQIFYYSENALRFKISDGKNKRFEVPSSLSDIANPPNSYTGKTNYDLEFAGEGQTFGFRIKFVTNYHLVEMLFNDTFFYFQKQIDQ